MVIIKRSSPLMSSMKASPWVLLILRVSQGFTFRGNL